MILVDKLRNYGFTGAKKGRWCHMASDVDTKELHVFAKKMGLGRHRFHRGHYDLRLPQRAKAIAAGAQEVSFRDMMERMKGDAKRLKRVWPR